MIRASYHLGIILGSVIFAQNKHVSISQLAAAPGKLQLGKGNLETKLRTVRDFCDVLSSWFFGQA